MTDTLLRLITLKEYMDIWYGPEYNQVFEYSCCICYKGSTDLHLLNAIVENHWDGSNKPIGHSVVCSEECFNMWLLKNTGPI
jgi:hypothetical protein